MNGITQDRAIPIHPGVSLATAARGAAVGIGFTCTLLGDPLMATLTTLPLALIPLFGVGLSGASHIVALNALRRV